MSEAKSMSKEAIKHYESALHEAFPSGATGNVFKHWNRARQSVAEAAKQEQRSVSEHTGEPVENRFVRELREYGKTNQGAYLFPSWDIHRALKYLHGYTTPQQRKPLTDEQVMELWPFIVRRHEAQGFIKFARAIEAAHDIKEKNNGT